MLVSTTGSPFYPCFAIGRRIMDSQQAIRKFSHDLVSPGSGFSPPVAGVTVVPNRFPSSW